MRIILLVNQPQPSPKNADPAKDREELFHDQWALSLDPRDVMVDAAWEAATCPEHLWIREKLGDLRGKNILDLGCGAGEAAVWFAKQGAMVVASDLSSAFLDLVGRVAALHGVHLILHQADADRLNLPENTFDIVYAGNLLHHVNLPQTLDQIQRVLRPGGKLVSWDPLRHNPIINIYRKMANPVRTADEHPLHIRDLQLFRDRFESVDAAFFWLATLSIFIRFFLIERIHPAKDRYWKRIIRDHQRLAPIYHRWSKLDRLLLRTFPFLKRYCWNIAIHCTKTESPSTPRA